MIPIKLGIQQRVLPAYRVPFFDALAESCPQGLSVFAGQPRPSEALGKVGELHKAVYYPAVNRHLLQGPLYICWQQGIVDWLSDWQPDVLITTTNPRCIRTKAALNWMRRNHRPVIGWGLGAPGVSSLRAFFRDGFIRQFDALLTYSQQGKEEYTALGFPDNRIFVAPNAAVSAPSQALPQRSPIHFSEDRAKILFVGRLQSRKRVDLLINACARIPEQLQPDLWIVGDGEIRQDLEELAAQIYPRTEFLGAKFGTELDPIFTAADIFVLPGTGGLAVQTAMSFGLPVIVGQADGTQVDLVRPDNGWMLPSDEVADVANLIREALVDIPRLRSMGAASYRIVAEEVNLENMVRSFSRAVNVVLED
jgi:glycosyltransferase involved in cell wall biosynthesis